MTRKTTERELLLQLHNKHGYQILEMPRTSERTIGAFKRRGSRMTYSTAAVVRLVVPEKSWLGREMQAKRSKKKCEATKKTREATKKTREATRKTREATRRRGR